ncbi:hypothetical protein AAEX28_02410 [Lentisphaerota bacterium WC36G]|nr:hypothetical protein LJT99_05295 [Lentisphaerae bacterium WC36]
MTRKEQFKEFKKNHPHLEGEILNELFSIEYGLELEDGSIAKFDPKYNGFIEIVEGEKFLIKP